MKRLDKLRAPRAIQIEDHSEAAKKIREELFGNYMKEQLNAVPLTTA